MQFGVILNQICLFVKLMEGIQYVAFLSYDKEGCGTVAVVFRRLKLVVMCKHKTVVFLSCCQLLIVGAEVTDQLLNLVRFLFVHNL